MPEHEHAPAHKHEQIRKYTLGKIYMKGNVTEPVCIIHISGVTAISNPYGTVDYACKFSCLQTMMDFVACLSIFCNYM